MEKGVNMKDNLTELIFILDRSGSMQSMAVEAIGGFNAFLEEQKKQAGEAKLTLVLFDNEYLLVHDGKNIQEVEPLNETTFQPRGTTGLLDAVGRTVDDVGRRLSETPEADRPSKVLVAILTDGQENASSDYTRSKIHDMITHQTEKYSWQFLFLAANQDAFAEATNLGISLKNTASYTADAQGLTRAFASVSYAASSYRTTGDLNNLNDTLNQTSTTNQNE